MDRPIAQVRRAAAALLIAGGLVLACVTGASASAVTPPLPAEVMKTAPQLHPLGQGVLRFVFWKIYDIALYVPGAAWDRDGPYALAVVYARSFTGAEIADEGVKQMRHLGYQDPRQLDRWRADMLMGFSVVHPGDRVAAVFFPPDETRFYINDRLTADIHDLGFSQAFFAIWLSPQTNEPMLRQTLLGEGR